MPITLLSDRKTAQDSEHHIFMWNEAHNINYSPLSTHTNTACLRVYMQYSMRVHMQMHTCPDSSAATFKRVVCTLCAFIGVTAMITFIVFILSVSFVTSRQRR